MLLKLYKGFGTVFGLFLLFIIYPLISGLVLSLLNKALDLKELFNDPWVTIIGTYSLPGYFAVNPINGGLWCLSAYTVYRIIRLLISGQLRKNDEFEQKAEYGSHGTSRWQTDEEMQAGYYQSKEGIIVGDVEKRVYLPGKPYAVIPNNGQQNLNIIAFGPPGSEKTTGIVLPNMLHTGLNLGYSMVITDPKGELYSLTSPLLREKGYEIYVLDFLHLKRGNRINFGDFVYEDTDLMKIAESYVTGGNVAKGSKGSSDPIWDDGEKSLLGALIGFVKQVYKDSPEKQTFEQIARILNTQFKDEDDYQYLFKRNEVSGTAEFLFNNFLMAKDKVRDGILFGLATKLTLFGIPAVQRLTNHSDFNLEDLGRKKIALYLLVSDSDKTFAPLVTVLWSILFSAIYKVRLTEPNSKVPVLCLMDELANIGRIGGLQEKLGTMRSRHIYPVMIWQSLPQLKDRYPQDAWEDVISMCDTRLLLAANDQVTKKYFSEELGKTTIKTESGSTSIKREEVIQNGESQSTSYSGRPLLFPDEVGRMPKDSILVVEKGKYPAMLKKLQYRYWEEKYQICVPTTYNDIPLLGAEMKLPNVRSEENVEETM
ncbi:VirD4-like conjugal transfer protein, CD1115 family [Paenibacillus jiagnxiensis]|uniref:VirD4-like conjugal transfer protein, CD1115 family n=1 Tax=Paenibacillus jiagnxiensis TaxID=3228926 RepID=UPI00339F1439